MNLKESLFGLCVFILLALVMTSTDAVETFFEFTREHESWELDEGIVIAISMIVGGMVFLLFRQHRQTKELQIEKEIANSASKTKSQMIITVGHELRTPLTSIRAALGILRKNKPENFDDQTRELLDLAERNALRLINLVEDTLSVERISGNLVEFAYSDISVSGLLRQAFDENHLSGSESGIAIRMEATETESYIHADESRLLQVFSNMTSNAVKYSEEGDEIVIGSKEGVGTLIFSVKDSGSGIPEEFRDHVFESFARADASESFHEGGVGLGMAISKAIIEAHGGKIWFESELGRGSTFFFELPEIKL